MHWILDLIVAAIIIVSTIFAHRKGLIKSLFSLLGTVIALVLSFLLRAPVAAWIDGAVVNESVKKIVLQTLGGSKVGDYQTAVAQIDVVGKLQNMPQSIRSFLESFGIQSEQISDAANQVGVKTAQANNRLIESIADPISATISNVAAFVLLFIILSIACFVAARFLSLIFEALPFGKTVNKVGGALLGVVRGVLIVYVLIIGVSAIANISGVKDDSIFSPQSIEKTVLVKNVQKINPLALFFK